MNKAGRYGYEQALEVPDILQAFRDWGKPLAERLAQFNPARDPLLGDDKKPTKLMMYCACENRLGEVLAQWHWPNPLDLIKVKQTLEEALPPYYRKKFSADLDTTAQVRGAATDGVLKRLGGKPRLRGEQR